MTESLDQIENEPGTHVIRDVEEIKRLNTRIHELKAHLIDAALKMLAEGLKRE